MLRIRKFGEMPCGAASGDLLRKLGFASGNLIASRQAHSDARAMEFSFFLCGYATTAFRA